MNTYPGQSQQGVKPGMKKDEGKARWDLVEFPCLDQMVNVLTMGAEKYEENNWKKIDNPQDRYFAALMRHISAWRSGEKTDKESGQNHMAHIMANAMFLMYFDTAREEGQ